MNKKNLTIATLIALSASCIIFAWYRDWIIIAIPSKMMLAQTKNLAKITKKKVSLFYRKKTNTVHTAYGHEIKELLWTEYTDKNILAVLQAWATLIEEEDLLEKKITVQTAALDVKNNELIISFDRSPFNKHDAAFKKQGVLETLFKTLLAIQSEEFSQLQTVRFLVHNRPMHDEHLDFSQPWPLYNGPHEPLKLHQNSTTTFNKQPLIIVLDPAGDANHAGRSIDDVFERSITFRCAQELKKKLEALFPAITVYLTRFSGDAVEPLQNAVFANRLGADLYISLSCYKETTNTSHLSLITFNYEPHYDYDMPAQSILKKPSQISLVPLHKAYREHLQETNAVAHALHDILNSPEYKNKIAVESLRAFPYKPLLGVNTVAIGIELGLTKKDDWHFIISAITQAFEKLLVHA